MTTKAEFVIDIIVDARSFKSTNTSAKRTVKALKALGLEPSEVVRVMHCLEYCDGAGEPFYKEIKRCW